MNLEVRNIQKVAMDEISAFFYYQVFFIIFNGNVKLESDFCVTVMSISKLHFPCKGTFAPKFVKFTSKFHKKKI